MFQGFFTQQHSWNSNTIFTQILVFTHCTLQFFTTNIKTALKCLVLRSISVLSNIYVTMEPACLYATCKLLNLTVYSFHFQITIEVTVPNIPEYIDDFPYYSWNLLILLTSLCFVQTNNPYLLWYTDKIDLYGFLRQVLVPVDIEKLVVQR